MSCRSRGLHIVTALFLLKTMCEKTSLVGLKGAIRAILDLVDLLAGSIGVM
jgi:hypothetical protein